MPRSALVYAPGIRNATWGCRERCQARKSMEDMSPNIHTICWNPIHSVPWVVLWDLVGKCSGTMYLYFCYFPASKEEYLSIQPSSVATTTRYLLCLPALLSLQGEPRDTYGTRTRCLKAEILCHIDNPFCLHTVRSGSIRHDDFAQAITS